MMAQLAIDHTGKWSLPYLEYFEDKMNEIWGKSQNPQIPYNILEVHSSNHARPSPITKRDRMVYTSAKSYTPSLIGLLITHSFG